LLVAKVTDAVWNTVQPWQSRPLGLWLGRPLGLWLVRSRGRQILVIGVDGAVKLRG